MDKAVQDNGVQARVAQGAAWLDIVRPGWEGLIVLDQLDIRRPFECVAGQVFGRDADADKRDPGHSGYTWCRLYMLGGHSDLSESRVQSYAALCSLGLDEQDGYGDVLDALTDAWRDLVETRRADNAMRAEVEAFASLPEDPAAGCIS